MKHKKIESLMSPAKQRLLELEKTGKYFFHSSPDEIEKFETRQASNWVSGVKEKDGEPGVFASPSIDYAIAMSLLTTNLDVITSAESKEAEKFTIRFFVSQDTFKSLNPETKGYVYIFNKDDFPIKNGPSEFKSLVPVTFLEKSIVTKKDLPEYIEIK